MAPTQPEPAYEPYRPPPVISHERVNPFDKNKPPVYDNKTSGIYSSLASNNPPASIVAETPKPVVVDSKPAAPVTSFTSTTSGFDYSYKPPTLPAMPVYTSKESLPSFSSKETLPSLSSKETIEKQDSTEEKKEPRHKFERKLSDADIIFGAKPEPYTSSFKLENYSRNRSNSSFTSTSTDSNYMYGAKDLRRDNPFQKSLSVSSDKDGDFSHDPTVLESRAYQGISNDAFTDYDSPKTSAAGSKPWSNNDEDDDYDLK